MPKGFHDGFSGNTNYYDTYRECMAKGAEYIEAESKEIALSRHNCVHAVTVKDNNGNVICTAQVNGFIK